MQAGLTWRIYIRDKKAQGGQIEAPADHWLVKLKERPNPWVPWIIWEDIVRGIEYWQDLDPFGTAYLWMPLQSGQKYPTSIWVVPSNLVTPVSRDGNPFSGFLMTSPNGQNFIPKEEMCAIPLVTPREDLATATLRGRGRIEALLDEIDVGFFVRRYLKNHFERGAIPPAVIEGQEEKYQADRQAFMQEFLEQHQGSENVWRPIYLPGGTQIKILDTLANQKSLVGMSEQIFRSVAMFMRVPWGMLTGEYSGPAPATGYRSQRWTFEKSVIEPLADREAKIITRFFNDYYDPNVIVGFEPIEWNDPAAVIQDEQHRLDAGQATINDLRRERGLELVDDSIANMLLPSPARVQSYMALTGVISGSQDAQQVQTQATDQQAGQQKSFSIDRVKAWKAKDDLRGTYAALLKRDAQKVLRKVEKIVLGSIASKSYRTGGLYDVDEVAKLWDSVTSDTRSELVNEAMRNAFQDVGESWDDRKTDFEAEVDAEINRSSALIKAPSESIHNELQKLLVKMQNDSIEDVTKAITQRFDDYTEVRAELISTTTSAVTINASQRAAWKGLGIKRSWLTRRDSLVRDAHQIDGQIEDDNGEFTLTDGSKVEYPNAPHERCYTLPEVAQTNPQAT